MKKTNAKNRCLNFSLDCPVLKRSDQIYIFKEMSGKWSRQNEEYEN